MVLFFYKMGWRTLYIEESNYASLYLDNLKIKSDDDKYLLIPLSDINVIVLDNYKMNVSVNLLIKIMEYNIDLIICHNNHLPIGQFIPFSGNCASSIILREQLSWDEKLKGKLWQSIVMAKILNQLKIMKKYNSSDEEDKTMISFYNSVNEYDTGNREGLAAKYYFRSLFGNDFKRFDNNCINAGLNYGYSILRSLISKCLISRGLNTSLGIFHKGPNNCFNLSDDIIEVFRPIIDDWVKENLSNELLFSKNHRLEIIKLINKKVYIDGKKQTISNAILIYIDSIINYLSKASKNVLFPDPNVYDI